MVGKPWRRWASDFDACNCYGLVLLYHRSVLGIELGPMPLTDIATGFAAARGWVECGPQPGVTAFMTFEDGAPRHCGVLLPRGELIHAQEGHPTPEDGQTRITRLAAMARLCPDLRFYRHERCS